MIWSPDLRNGGDRLGSQRPIDRRAVLPMNHNRPHDGFTALPGLTRDAIASLQAIPDSASKYAVPTFCSINVIRLPEKDEAVIGTQQLRPWRR
jgi:hypothetical protein